VEFPKQNKWLLVIWVSAVSFENCANLRNPLEKKICLCGDFVETLK
jgi:hypothetical protein